MRQTRGEKQLAALLAGAWVLRGFAAKNELKSANRVESSPSFWPKIKLYEF